jgi:hypothetical protein
MSQHLKAANYFEGRAKRARHPDERARFLRLVQKYRDLAAEEDAKTKPANNAADSGVGVGDRQC